MLAWPAFARVRGTDCNAGRAPCSSMLNMMLRTPMLALGAGVGFFFPCCGRLRGRGVAAGGVGRDVLAIRAGVPQQGGEEEGSRCSVTLSVPWPISGCNSL